MINKKKSGKGSRRRKVATGGETAEKKVETLNIKIPTMLFDKPKLLRVFTYICKLMNQEDDVHTFYYCGSQIELAKYEFFYVGRESLNGIDDIDTRSKTNALKDLVSLGLIEMRPVKAVITDRYTKEKKEVERHIIKVLNQHNEKVVSRKRKRQSIIDAYETANQYEDDKDMLTKKYGDWDAFRIIEGLKGQVNELNGKVSGLEGQVSGLNGQVSGLESEIADLVSVCDGQGQRITQVECEYGDLNEVVRNQGEIIAKNSEDIKRLEAEVAELKGKRGKLSFTSYSLVGDEDDKVCSEEEVQYGKTNNEEQTTNNSIMDKEKLIQELVDSEEIISAMAKKRLTQIVNSTIRKVDKLSAEELGRQPIEQVTKERIRKTFKNNLDATLFLLYNSIEAKEEFIKNGTVKVKK